MKIGTKFTKKDDNEGEETVADVIATMNEKQLNAMYYIVSEVLEGESDDKSEFNKEETIADVIATMNEKQLNAMYYIVSEALEGESDDKSEFNNGHHIKAGEYGDPKEVWV